MAADEVALLLEVVFGGALLVAPIRPDGGTYHQAAAGYFCAPAHLPAHGHDAGNYCLDVRPSTP
jgi:hypothetical protein